MTYVLFVPLAVIKSCSIAELCRGAILNPHADEKLNLTRERRRIYRKNSLPLGIINRCPALCQRGLFLDGLYREEFI